MKIINEYTYKELCGFHDAIEAGSRYVMLRGGTGTGKTMYARELAWWLTHPPKCNAMTPDNVAYYSNDSNNDSKYIADNNEEYYTLSCEEDSEHILIIPFHKGSSYENTVYGLSLKTQAGRIVYENELKQFARMCKRALTKSDEQFVIILDDINRADLSRALGDVMQALESSGKNRSIPIEGENVPIPDNLYIIATANPTFGSSPDYAWLRRFLVFDITPDEKHITAPEFIRLRNRFEGMNYFNESNYEKYLDYAFCIFKYIKIMYERYFADDDLTIKLQNCPGHGMFMLPYVENQSFEKYVELFHLKLKHIIVPFLRCALADGLLKNDKVVRFDIDMLDRLGECRIKPTEALGNNEINIPKEATNSAIYHNYIVKRFEMIDIPIFYFLYLRNPLFMRTPFKTCPKEYFLYEPHEHYYKKKTNNGIGVDLHIEATESVLTMKLHAPASLSQDKVQPSTSDNSSPGYISIVFYKIFGRIYPGVINSNTNKVLDKYNKGENKIAMQAVLNAIYPK